MRQLLLRDNLKAEVVMNHLRKPGLDHNPRRRRHTKAGAYVPPGRHRPLVTHVVLILRLQTPDGERRAVYTGVAWPNDAAGDQFSRRVGRDVALGRALDIACGVRAPVRITEGEAGVIRAEAFKPDAPRKVKPDRRETAVVEAPSVLVQVK